MKELTNDFKKFALDKTNAKSSVLDATIKNATTPYILEERKLNVSQLDVFSRLMYDRIVFLSGEVTPESMDTITAQLLFLDSIETRDIISLLAPDQDRTVLQPADPRPGQRLERHLPCL